MRHRSFVSMATVSVVTLTLLFRSAPLGSQTATDVAVFGQITSAEKGAMEGVLGSAKRVGSTITTTAFWVGNNQGASIIKLETLA